MYATQMLAGEYLPKSGLPRMHGDVEFKRLHFGREAIVLVVDRDGRESHIEECFRQSCATREDLYYERLIDMLRQDAVGETYSAKRTV